MTLDSMLQNRYNINWNTCIINSSIHNTLQIIINKILMNKIRYVSVTEGTTLPWYIVAAIHNMESSQDFSKHLHNGDPLTNRTVHIPRGRPLSGKAPFTWEISAIDALQLSGLYDIKYWDIPTILFNLEKYNGLGYLKYHSNINTPYLWSGTNKYISGKYTHDGKFNSSAVSNQIGCVPILKNIFNIENIIFKNDIMHSNLTSDEKFNNISYSTTFDPNAIELQNYINTQLNINIKVDGIPGKVTSNFYKQIFGKYLNNDPRN